MRVVLAFSGGLDTSFCVAYLKEERRAEVLTVTVNTGGASRADLDLIAEQARALGAAQHREIDARQAVYDGYVATLIRGNVLRGEVYPLCVAAVRTQQAIEVARIAREIGADAVAHGSTGAGNDQVRFDVAMHVLLPGVPILTPIRDLGLSREQATAYLEQRSLPVPEGSGRFSINRGLWGTTLGGEWTHDPWSAPPRDAWDEPADEPLAQTERREIVIGWKDGLPVQLGGRPLAGPDLVERLGRLTHAYGIGKGIHLGETALGIKGRIGFEAGAALVLIAAHRELEKLTLTRWQLFWKDHLARFYGDRLHEGQAFDPVMRDITAMIASSQQRVAGETRVELSARQFRVLGVRSPFSLFDPEVARYGETNALWDGEEARAFSKLAAIPSMLAFRAGHVDERLSNE
ncbi:MAG: argininosuccinate synthase [Acidobacteriota bacterium]|nr:MAG: argininosuccinate synthase [Acidobacteriota bacterium]